jgi:hypothetical protein
MPRDGESLAKGNRKLSPIGKMEQQTLTDAALLDREWQSANNLCAAETIL